MQYPRLTRRHFLQWTGVAGTGWLITGCIPAQPSAPASAAAPAQSATGTQAPQPGGRLRISPPDTAVNLDPALFGSTADMFIIDAVYEGLVATDTTDPAWPLVPRLAESWTVSDDGLEWTFQLRSGVQFHHGTPFTAQDVVYSIERILDPAFPAPGKDRIRYVTKVEAVDDGTPAGAVRFQLDSPVVTFLRTLGDPLAGLAIVPHDRSNDELAQQPSGTGPFQLTAYMPGERVSFQRHAAYWDAGLPYLAELEHLYIGESAAQVAALISGTVDIIPLSVENIPLLESNPDVQILSLAGGSHDLFIMRADQEPFQDVRVRQAFKLAIDRAALQQVVLQGLGQLGNDQPIPPDNPFWADLPIPQQDSAKAKALLAEAGYPDGVSVTLTLAEVGPGLLTAAVALQEMVKAAGITLEIERVPVDRYWTDYYMKTPFFVSVWGNPIDPDQMLSLAYQADAIYNETGWQNPDLDALIQAGRVERDEAKRHAIYAQAQQLISEEGCSIIPYFRPLMLAMHSSVQNFASGVRTTWLAQG